MKHRIVGISLVVVLACSAPLATGDVLIGTWSDSNVSFTTSLAATPVGASLTTPCTTVNFEPIRLDDSLAFHATGIVTRAVGLVLGRVGDSYPITGRLLGERLVLGSDTLTRASVPSGVRVCNA